MRPPTASRQERTLRRRRACRARPRTQSGTPRSSQRRLCMRGSPKHTRARTPTHSLTHRAPRVAPQPARAAAARLCRLAVTSAQQPTLRWHRQSARRGHRHYHHTITHRHTDRVGTVAARTAALARPRAHNAVVRRRHHHRCVWVEPGNDVC
jgi:hypothetical protein